MLTSKRRPTMPKTQPKGPDLLALAMRRARDDVAAGRVHSPEPASTDSRADQQGEDDGNIVG